MNRLFDLIGFDTPAQTDYVEAAVGAGLTLAALGIGWLAGRKLGPWVTDWWKERAGGHAALLGPRICAILRWSVAALLLALVVNAWPWPPLGAPIVGFGLGLSVALLVRHILRAVRLPSWMSWLVSLLLFAAIVSQGVGGLAEISATLDQVGVDVGRRRISLLSVITLLITAIALYAIARLALRLVGHSILRAERLDPTQKLLAQKLAAIAVIVAAFFIGIDLIGVDLTALAVFSGAFGLAIGFGLQKTIGNLIAGIILLMDRSIKPGDVISVGDSFGKVSKIGVRAVSVITREAKEHLIPNEILMTEEVVNWSYSSRNVRIGIPVGVDYSSDIRLAQRLMAQAAAASDRVLDSPAPKVWLREFGESAVKHEIRLWIVDPEEGVGSVQSEVLNRVWDLFKEHGIAMPFPQMDVHLKSVPEGFARAKDGE